MIRETTLDALRDYVRGYFESPDIELNEGSDLIATVGSIDPDKFTDFLEQFTDDYAISMPAVPDSQPSPPEPERNPFMRFWSWVLTPWEKQPQLYVDRITLGELREIAHARVWPARLLRLAL